MSSSSSPKEKDKGSEDFDIAMDAPDSPPEFTQGAGWQPAKEPQAPAQANTGSRVNGETKAHFGTPGSCWQTKKFSEEYERAEANLVDKQWNPTQYGDPLSPR